MNMVLRGATLIDGTGSPPLPDAAVHIQDGKIAWVGPASDLEESLAQVPQQNLSGKYIIPGLIDAHVHVCWNGRESVLVSIARDRDYLILEAVQTLRNILRTGTTAVRDVGGHHYLEMSLRQAIEAGFIVGPRMRVSGRVIAMTGGHAHFIAREADGPEEVRKAAREQIKAGADTVKLMATGGAATPGQDVMASQLTLEEMRAACEAAHALGRTVAAHCHGTGGIRNAVLAGVDTIEHCTFLDEETADLMAERGTAMVLTLSVAKPDPNNVPPDQSAEFKRLSVIFETIRDHVARSIELAREKGVFLAVGTDAGGNALAPHHYSMQRELEMLVSYGISPLEALRIATCNNAQVLRWADQIGTVEPGKFADLIVLDADPLSDISNVRRVSMVYKGGVVVSQ